MIDRRSALELLVYCGWGATCGLCAGLFDGAWLQAAFALWTFAFSAYFVWWFAKFSYEKASSLSLGRLLVQLTAFHLALLVALALCGRAQVLWVADSFNLHLPGVERIFAIWRGEAPLRATSVFEQVQLTHAWVAPWFAAFGKSPVVSALALLVLRVATWAVVYAMARDLFDHRVAVVAVLLSALVPTQIYYSMVFYKDPLVQFLAMAALYGAIRVYRRGDALGIALGLIATVALFLERIYLGPMVGVPLFFAAFFSVRSEGRGLRRVAICGLGLVALAIFYVAFERDFRIAGAIANLPVIRHGFSTYSDVDISSNFDIPYPLALLKILFTPFFTPRKFQMFTDLSALLTWGSFLSQLTIGLAIVGALRSFRRICTESFLLIFPIVIFLLMFAYLAPFSGRQRDSFFPVFALYAACEVCRISTRVFNKSQDKPHPSR